MLKLTHEQQLANINLAERLWQERVTPDRVYPGLRCWRDEDDQCGTTACFGGWLATWPEFRAMGVGRLGDFAPSSSWNHDAVALSEHEWGWHVARAIFGDDDLFEPRGGHPADPGYDFSPSDKGEMTDHALVLNRLVYSRRRLQEGGAQ